MKYAVIVQDTAIRSLEVIYRHIAQDEPVNAARYAQQLRKACESLKAFPKRCPVAFENGLGGLELRHLIFDSYRIIFTVQDKTVHILDIRHAARLPLVKEAHKKL
ncbi:MAG: type II toxin-antitoxin system RelE/ParE family toxin [Alphaproteobacteria bacterium]|nr:type II toxin-antitoxin system RelE/ParE family toxin [Alphaproteobacteria bacterium]